MLETELRGFLVTSAVGPGLWTEERTDEGNFYYESRQFGGFCIRRPPRRLSQAKAHLEVDKITVSAVIKKGFFWERARSGDW
jgi:hypothetical protein